MITFRTAYSTPVRSTVDFLDEEGNYLPDAEPMTEQCHRALCDVNTILKQYDKTGLITHVNTAKAQYGDFTQVNEYQESLNLVIRAQDAFDGLPSHIRKRFGNDPGTFLEFATDPSNGDAMVEMGLAEAITPVVEPAPVDPELAPTA